MTTTDLAVHRSVTVALPPDRAFALFTRRMEAWWPRGHSIGQVPMDEVVVEPRVGGRWFERGADGSECDWGRVAAWEPPGRLVLLWQIGADWAFDPELETEVEIGFVDDGAGRTRVELTHHHLERYGDAAGGMLSVFDSPGAWSGILDRLAVAAAGGPVHDHLRATDTLDAVVATLGPHEWDAPSMCSGWTVRDVLGHVTWGHHLVAALAGGRELTDRRGAGGTEHPGVVVGDDPLPVWRAARVALLPTLTAEALARPGPERLRAIWPDLTLGDFVGLLALDALAHAWDVGHALGRAVRLPADIVERAGPLLVELRRAPGSFGPELTPPDGADAQTRWLASLGRAAWDTA